MWKNYQHENFIDGCLSARLLNMGYEYFDLLSDIPDILSQNELWLSSDAILYLFGHEELLDINKYKNLESHEIDLGEFFDRLANHPLIEQVAFSTNLLHDENIELVTSILGCSNFDKNHR